MFSNLELCQLSVEMAADEVFWMRPDSTIAYVNQSACDKLRYTREELIGMHVWDWDPLFDPKVWDGFLAEIRSKGSIFFGTHHRTKDGKVFPVEIKGHHFELDGEEYIFAYVSDISEQKEKQDALKRYRENLETLVHERTLALEKEKEKAEEVARELEQSRQEAVGLARVKAQFLANMSHEIRTPMNGVMGMANALLQTGLSTEQLEQVQAILDCTQSLKSIIDDVLDLSKIESGKLSVEAISVDLWDCLAQVKNATGQMAVDKGLALEFPPRPPQVQPYLGDPHRIQQILINLVGNAIKFTEHGGVYVDVRFTPLDATTDNVEISVRDTGIGIDPDMHETLFERFTQSDSSTTRRFGGSGLGLSICKQLVKLMHGEIGVRSDVDTGAEFWFRLPLARDTACALNKAEPEPITRFRDYSFAGARVLLVEDNDVNQKVATVALRHVDVLADVAANGLEAVQMCSAGTYDLVLMDCHMPVLDGYAAAQQIRALPGWETVPIVALTANAMADERYRCENAGMTDFMSKPFDFKDLAALLLHHLPQFARRRAE
ncbi:ATP-binding protein [Mangrovimicrobium sediminis]|uniref:ATP-binding protein n=1 Tax=Mangrovimicrobium sediminis TaxID=2562682 RepID=UPI00143694E4|nr:ATP-binding protein [Haliea sp. SAOS-164]